MCVGVHFLSTPTLKTAAPCDWRRWRTPARHAQSRVMHGTRAVGYNRGAHKPCPSGPSTTSHPRPSRLCRCTLCAMTQLSGLLPVWRCVEASKTVRSAEGGGHAPRLQLTHHLTLQQRRRINVQHLFSPQRSDFCASDPGQKPKTHTHRYRHRQRQKQKQRLTETV